MTAFQQFLIAVAVFCGGAGIGLAHLVHDSVSGCLSVNMARYSKLLCRKSVDGFPAIYTVGLVPEVYILKRQAGLGVFQEGNDVLQVITLFPTDTELVSLDAALDLYF